MISAIINVAGASPGPTFASLGAAATDGFVREVIVADASASEVVSRIAEDAGAMVVHAGRDSVARACAAARQPWLLMLCSGTRLQAGWEEVAWRHINDHGDRAGWFRLSLRAPGLAARAAEARANIGASLLGRLRAEHGLLISHSLYDGSIGRGAPVGLPLGIRAGSLRRLSARILA